MPSIDSRIAKLEQNVRHDDDHRTKEERDAEFAAKVSELLPIAILCNSPEELKAHMKSKQPSSRNRVVSLEEQRQTDAVLGALARTIFEEVNG